MYPIFLKQRFIIIIRKPGSRLKISNCFFRLAKRFVDQAAVIVCPSIFTVQFY